MNLKLDNKVVIITGATGGIGGDIVAEFLREKAIVVCLIRNELKMEEFKSNLIKEDIPVNNLYSYKCDLLNYDDIVKSVGDINKKFGKVNSLVNCAGYTKEYPFAMLDEDEISHTLDINLKSPMMLTHAILRIMFRQKNGSIINVSSISAVKKGRGIVAYASAKSGIENFTRTLASEVGKKNIRVNCIRPGIIETSMSGQVMSRTKDQIKEITCLGRFGKTKEISKMATFLASDNSSSYITGECITIDGGII
jgi:3-oxoacyl-[acyl-carrier protein] reductase